MKGILRYVSYVWWHEVATKRANISKIFSPDNKKVCLVFKHPQRLISYEFEYKLFSKLGKEAICTYQLKVVSPGNSSLLTFFFSFLVLDSMITRKFYL